MNLVTESSAHSEAETRESVMVFQTLMGRVIHYYQGGGVHLVCVCGGGGVGNVFWRSTGGSEKYSLEQGGGGGGHQFLQAYGGGGGVRIQFS